MTTSTDRLAVTDNGTGENLLSEAVVYEAAIAAEAQEIRAGADELTPALFLKLWPLLCLPIPRGFIESTDAVKGKPYPSTGVRSMQVQVDRMNNVLTPLWWSWETLWSDEGKRCIVEVVVGTPPLVVRRSPGGVNQASTTGNLYKGSETNAAKRAFAAIGPGHEVYLGATDFDPDTDQDAAKAQESDKPPAVETIAADSVARLMEAVHDLTSSAEDKDDFQKVLKLKLGSIGVSGSTVGQALAKLTPAQAAEIDGWLAEQKGAQ